MPPPQISVVAPTYREAENLSRLAEAVDKALRGAGYGYELIIADDDSGDGTPALCAELARKYPLRLLSRFANRGLSAAVIDGIGEAAGEAVIVMDADLSHPPERLPQMAELLLSGEADFVVGSRYVAGGGLDANWPLWRRLNSLVATAPAKMLIPIADPMSGFFGLRRADMPAAEKLSPIGYKIGLELAVKGGFSRRRIREVPIHFRDREFGESKMNWRERLNYLRHLRRLCHHKWEKPMEIGQFLAVGLSGFVIDVSLYLLLSLGLGAPHLLARAVAYWPAVTSNWLVNRVMTFKERPRGRPFLQWGAYALFGGVGFCVNWGTYALLTSQSGFFADHLLLALFVGVVAGTIFNFIASDWIVFRRAGWGAER